MGNFTPGEKPTAAEVPNRTAVFQPSPSFVSVVRFVLDFLSQASLWIPHFLNLVPNMNILINILSRLVRQKDGMSSSGLHTGLTAVWNNIDGNV